MTRTRRGTALLVALWVVTLAAGVVVAMQERSFAQAAAGREALGRVRAYWAARGGIEAAIALLADEAEQPVTDDAFSIFTTLDNDRLGRLDGASYEYLNTARLEDGSIPSDAHSRLSINAASRDHIMRLDFMTDDVADSIVDWVDEDDDTQPLGAEIGYYLNRRYGYEPRNAPMRSIKELELVAGVLDVFMYGEDTNLNTVLDANENDGRARPPTDDADGRLDVGWAGLLTTASRRPTLGMSGETLLDLTTAEAGDVAARVGVDQTQGEAVLAVAAQPGASLGTFIVQPLDQMVNIQNDDGGGGQRNTVRPLTDEQLQSLLDECSIGDPTGLPGRLNINTCSRETLELINELSDAGVDAIIYGRDDRAQGYTSIVDLTELSGLSRQQVGALYEILCVRSHVVRLACRGTDERTGVSVEITASLDRASLPMTIDELEVR